MYKVVLIKGDGIGPEIADAVVEIFSAAKVPFEWIEKKAGLSSTDIDPSGLPQETMDAILEHGLALKGPTTTPVGTGHKSVNVTLRKSFELYANVRPAKTLPGVNSRYNNVDLIIVRENIEDTYGGIEHIQTNDVAQCLKLITRPGSLRIAKYAFEMARALGRKRVTAVHKANIHKMTDGLFLDCFRTIAKEYPDIQSDDIIVDNACMQLVSRPEQFDVLVLPNLFGDIVSDLCAGIVGGLGVAPGGNIGERCSVFEAVHGSAPDIAGKGIANPTAMLLSGIQLLQYVGLNDTATRIEQALKTTLESGVKTGDLGGKATTKEFTEAIISHLGEAPAIDETPKPLQLSVSGVMASTVKEQKWIGVDVFVEYADGIPPVPEKVGTLSLKMISNRGTKVYPGNLPLIWLVNHHRCRYVAPEGSEVNNSDVLALLTAMMEKNIQWMHIEKLQTFDGENGFSKAQGE